MKPLISYSPMGLMTNGSGPASLLILPTSIMSFILTVYIWIVDIVRTCIPPLLKMIKSFLMLGTPFYSYFLNGYNDYIYYSYTNTNYIYTYITFI